MLSKLNMRNLVQVQENVRQGRTLAGPVGKGVMEER
jgi:hypothetical protein